MEFVKDRKFYRFFPEDQGTGRGGMPAVRSLFRARAEKAKGPAPKD